MIKKKKNFLKKRNDFFFKYYHFYFLPNVLRVLEEEGIQMKYFQWKLSS